MRDLAADLEALHRRSLYRERMRVDGAQGPEIEVDGRRYLAFCSNDYLGLAAHPEVTGALRRGAEIYGVGAGAAHLVNGHTAAHHALEEELAAFTGRERALLFSTGYMANLGVVSALAGRHDTVVEDRLDHASLVDAARLSGARLLRFPHADVEALERQLARAGEGETVIATDGVFSMDGDVAPLGAISTSAARAGAWLMVDDAHGLGVIGANGRGTLEQCGLGPDAVPVLVGTLGKALGTFGAFVAGSNALIETLIQSARTYIYTTAPPPAVAEATRASLRLVEREPWRRERLTRLVERFRSGAHELGLTLGDSATPIQPVIVGDPARALGLSDALREHGILVSAIRPPTVPQGTARLRVSLSAAHTEDHVDRLLGALEAAARDASAS